LLIPSCLASIKPKAVRVVKVLGTGFLLALSGWFFFFDEDWLHPKLSYSAPLLYSSLSTASGTTGHVYSVKKAHSHDKTLPWLAFVSASETPWKMVTLDRGLVHLKSVKEPLRLSESSGSAGSEAFFYTAHLLEQLAIGLPEDKLSHQMNQLSLDAQTMGIIIYQLSQMKYSGSSLDDVQHQLVQQKIEQKMQLLNRNAILFTQYNQQGKRLSHKWMKLKKEDSFDTLLTCFLLDLKVMLSNPVAKHYPETMALLVKQGKLLQQLAEHLHMSVEVWHTGQQASYSSSSTNDIKIYMHQSMPPETPLLITL
jgi:hypothetical protein